MLNRPRARPAPPATQLSITLLAGGTCAAPTAARAAEPVHPELWPAAAPAHLARATAAAVEPLLAAMSLEEKVAQMIQADIASITPADLARYPLGSILAGGNAAPHDDVRCAPRDWADLVEAFHRAALERPAAHRPIPVLFGIDAVHGNAKLIGATIFPHNVGLGAAHDPALVRAIGAATATEVAAAGIDWTFAPTVAVVRDVRWGRSYESYSESPDLVGAYAAAMVEGLQGTGLPAHGLATGHTLASVKHFLGDGGTRDGRDQGETQIPETELRATHAAGYLAALPAGALIVMASYNSWNGTKMHASRYLLTDILKGRLGFEGFVVGDWNAHEQIPGCTKTDCPAAINAGIDMLMAPDGWQALYEHTLAEARSGLIPMGRIDEAVRRILRVKFAAGLFDRGPPPAHLEALGAPAHRELARRAVRESLVLLKNERALLPLDPHAKILVAGEAADDIGLQSGGWTIDWQGDHNKNADFPGATSIFAGIERAVSAAGGHATLSADGQFKDRPDVAIVVFGEGPYAEFEGDRETLAFARTNPRPLELLKRLRKAGIPTVAVLLSGRPLWVNPEINAADAFVAAWLPGSEGEGLADVLLRGADGRVRHDFTGRLAFSWPATAMPVTFAANGTVEGAELARGAGLDYAHPASVPRLAEAAGIPAHFAASPAHSLFEEAHVIAPWSVFVADAGAQVHLTTSSQASPHARIEARLGPEGLTARWSGGGEGTLLISGRAQDLEPAAREGRALELTYRLETRPTEPVVLALGCVQARCGAAQPPAVDLTTLLEKAALGEPQTLVLRLACLAAHGADLSQVEAPFTVSTIGPLELTITSLRWHTPVGPAAPCP